MKEYRFLNKKGDFTLEMPENYSYLYFPIAGERGLKNAITPTLCGDSKLDQNTFLLEPVSAENLHNNKSTRNFWCHVTEGIAQGDFSVTGASARQMADKFTDKQEKSSMCAGFMWHTVERDIEEAGLHTEVTNFVPVEENVEIMMVSVKNTANVPVTFVPTAAVPIYGRSASNIRDHRHVTSLLHRIHTIENGVTVTPTLSFDERGHQVNHMTYYVCGYDGKGKVPQDFYPVTEDFVGEGGNFERPLSVIRNSKGLPAGYDIEGLEAVGGLHFTQNTLQPGEDTVYIVLFGITDQETDISKITGRYASVEACQKELDYVKTYWEEKVNVIYRSGNPDFDYFMHWVSFQPILRRIYGCSFLPHHDYGKGGRGWRDLWQDCLALLIMNPGGVRQMLLDNFGGVRMDGTNATIIGSKQGEFIADRNNITRVWMDHGVWPCMTTKLYIDQTGDIELLLKEVSYFKDKQVCRGTAIDTEWNEAYGSLMKDVSGNTYMGTVLEHLLLQNLTAFYEVGEHNEIRLRGADWNDALDMAEQRGESVAFTNAYAGNLADIADLLQAYQGKYGKTTVKLAKELLVLLASGNELYTNIERKNALLLQYSRSCIHEIIGEKEEVDISELIQNLRDKSNWMMEQIRAQEWVTDRTGKGWFNGYYDNHGRQVEGEKESGIRMMLTGQVFSIMAGTATKEQVSSICESADAYLYEKNIGGYRLNTDFHEVKTDLGRMFGFSYGDKENGAVFSHMAVMYGNALYKRGFVKEGHKVLSALSDQALNFPVSRIYPGIPEYFNGRGRGMYHYLTGAASWYMLTVVTEVYGVRGKLGNLVIEPKLLKEQFDEEGKAAISLLFAGRNWNIRFENADGKEYGEYRIKELRINGQPAKMDTAAGEFVLDKSAIEVMKEDVVQELQIVLG